MSKIYMFNVPCIFVGKSGINDISFPDCDFMASRHVKITKKNEGFCVSFLGDGGVINGRSFSKDDTVKVFYGDTLCVSEISLMLAGDYLFISGDYPVASKLSEVNDVDIYDDISNIRQIPPFTPSPRSSVVSIDQEPVELFAPPEKRLEEPVGKLITVGPAFSMMIPMVLGFIISAYAGRAGNGISKGFMYTGLITAVGSGIMGAIWASLNLKNREMRIDYNEKKRREVYEDYVKASENLIRHKYQINRNALCLMYPHIKEKFYPGNEGTFIFSNDISKTHCLKLRLGVGNLKFNIDISVPKDKLSMVPDDLKNLPVSLKNKYSQFTDVPILIDFTSSPMGVVCKDKGLRDELFRLIVISSVSEVAPDKLKIALIFQNDIGLDNSIYMLCHIWDGNQAYISINGSKLNDVLNSIMESNVPVLVMTDCYEKIKFLKGKTDVYIVIFADQFIQLPDCTKGIIQREEQFSGYIDLSEENKIRQAIYFDLISEKDFISYIREVACLSGGIKNEKRIPNKVSFLDLFHEDILSGETIKNNWSKNRTTENLAVPIGVNKDGNVFLLDFHEKGHGPHALIAGMTGSGKSEILQTIILSLAVKYSPDEISFFLIDYKGGGMAGLFNALPHLAGSISNLSGCLIGRAMVSIKSENEKRQKIFNANNVNNIYEYTRMYNSGEVKEPLPHVFIIVDEFAELKKEEPGFMKELISVARVGRSLGIHLVLATQKPSGTVDENIVSNSRIKICLKVQDKQDSNEMIKRPDAALIKNPGRAYIQIGQDELFDEIQTAYTMEGYNPKAEKEASIRFIDSKGELVDYSRQEAKDVLRKSSQLLVVLNEIIHIGKSINKSNEGKLWTKPLQKDLYINETLEGNKIIVGEYDYPKRQEKGYVEYSYVEDGHILILGTVGTGKSTFMSTISCRLVQGYTPEDINIYYLDFSNLKLFPYAESKLCGGYFYEDNEKNIDKLFVMLTEIIEERKGLLKGISYSQYCQKKKSTPAVILFIDGYGSFREHTAGEYDQTLLFILKNGENLGIYVIISALAISTAELPGRLFEHIRKVYTLNLNDRYKYSEALRCSGDKVINHDNVPGRGLLQLEGEILEYQVTKPVLCQDESQENDVIRQVIKERNQAVKSIHRARSVPLIPDNPDISHLLQYIEQSENDFWSEGNLTLPVGYEMSSGKIYSIPLIENRNIIISGKSKTGKTNLLSVIEIVSISKHLTSSREASLSFEHLIISSKQHKWIFAVYEENMGIKESYDLKTAVGDNAYIIHMGGCLDRQSIADYSYIPFMKQSEAKKIGVGTVHKNSDHEFFGDVLIVKGGNC